MVSTLNGIGAMPAKGLCMSCSDNELADAVTYMVDAAQ
jgi:cytochrome c5